MTNIYGQDISINENYNPTSSDGSVLLVSGIHTVLQDLKLRLFTNKGDLFYDNNYGSLFLQFLYEEDNDENRFALLDEVRSCLESYPGVVSGSVDGVVNRFDTESLELTVNFRISSLDRISNVVISVDKTQNKAKLDLLYSNTN